MFIKESAEKVIVQRIAGYTELKELESKNILPTLVELTDEEQSKFIEGVGFHELYESTSRNFLTVRYDRNYYSLDPFLINKKIEAGELNINGILLEDSSYHEVESLDEGGMERFGGVIDTEGKYIDIEFLNQQLAEEQIAKEESERGKVL